MVCRGQRISVGETRPRTQFSFYERASDVSALNGAISLLVAERLLYDFFFFRSK